MTQEESILMNLKEDTNHLFEKIGRIENALWDINGEIAGLKARLVSLERGIAGLCAPE